MELVYNLMSHGAMTHGKLLKYGEVCLSQCSATVGAMVYSTMISYRQADIDPCTSVPCNGAFVFGYFGSLVLRNIGHYIWSIVMGS